MRLAGWSHKKKDRTPYWEHATISPLRDTEGEITHFVAAKDDITEEKRVQQEKLIRQPNEAQSIAKMGYGEHDLPSNLLTWSDEVFRIFELAPQDFLKSCEFFLEFVHPDNRDLVDEAYKASVEIKKPYNLAHRIMLKSGAVKWVLEIGTIEYDGDTPVRAKGTVHDIMTEKTAAPERGRLIGELQAALSKIVTLRGILPICSYCKNIRDDERAWSQVEQYVGRHTDVHFSHGVCPGCIGRAYEEFGPKPPEA